MEERDQHAVGGSEEGVFGGGGPHQAEGLHRIGGKEQRAQHRTPPHIVRGEAGAPFPAAEQPHQDGTRGEAEGEQPQHRDRVQRVLHNEEGGAPNKGGQKQEGLGQPAHQDRIHGCSAPMFNQEPPSGGAPRPRGLRRGGNVWYDTCGSGRPCPGKRSTRSERGEGPCGRCPEAFMTGIP